MQALRQPRSRILIADAVGLGKTLRPAFSPLNSSTGARQAHPSGHPRQHRVQRQSAFAGEMQQRLQGTLADLERLQNEQVQQLALRLAKQLEQIRRSQFERRSQGIRRVFDEYRQWVEDTLSTEPEPCLQVLAAVCG